jgi:hypothetical protein
MRLLESLAYKYDLVRDVEEVYNRQTGDFEIIHVYGKGERPSEQERQKVVDDYRKQLVR